MQEHLFLCETDRAHRKGYTRQKVESLRDHADDCSDHGGHAVAESIVLDKKRLGEQHEPDRDDRDTHPFYQLVKRADHFRLLSLLHFLCLERELGNIGILSHFVKPRMALPGHDKASGHQLVPSVLCDLIRFPGKERLIHLHFTCGDHSVCTDLVSRLEYHDVVKHQILRIDHGPFSIPDHSRMRSIQHGQLIQHLLGPDLLYDTDQRVCDNDREKGQVAKGSHQAQQNSQYHEDQVEICKHILMYDLFCRL